MTEDSWLFDLQDFGQVCHVDIHRYLGTSHKVYTFWVRQVGHIVLTQDQQKKANHPFWLMCLSQTCCQ